MDGPTVHIQDLQHSKRVRTRLRAIYRSESFNRPNFRSPLNHIDSESVEIGVSTPANRPARSNPVPMPPMALGRGVVPVLIESGSASMLSASFLSFALPTRCSIGNSLLFRMTKQAVTNKAHAWSINIMNTWAPMIIILHPLTLNCGRTWPMLCANRHVILVSQISLLFKLIWYAAETLLLRCLHTFLVVLVFFCNLFNLFNLFLFILFIFIYYLLLIFLILYSFFRSSNPVLIVCILLFISLRALSFNCNLTSDDGPFCIDIVAELRPHQLVCRRLTTEFAFALL